MYGSYQRLDLPIERQLRWTVVTVRFWIRYSGKPQFIHSTAFAHFSPHIIGIIQQHYLGQI
jgi:hypothetical protein